MYRLVLFTCLCSFVVMAYHSPLNEIPGEQQRRENFFTALQNIDFDDVKKDLKALFVDSKPWWPADYGHYGPFFIRLAWHCSGSYRVTDGRGGCAGGRQRFDPERSWQDNTNLDKARKLLWPVKEKYGLGLSWGDLFILAGTTAIEDLGGTTLGFCAGRVDQPDGSQSEELNGPPATCDTPGDCQRPYGTTTVGLIYLNPEGPEGKPIPEVSCKQIRDTFGRMSMNDTETVALIGGGHSFGKTHGACATPPGPAPKDAPANPWAGKCGTGAGTDAWTSGFEGPWTTNPTKFDNQYFKNLIFYNWAVEVGPGGHHQWYISNSSPPTARSANGTGNQNLMMLTSDVSLIHDVEYKKIVQKWATDADDFTYAFKYAWYKLTTRDQGPVTRCYGTATPPPQPFQYPLPEPPSTFPDWGAVQTDIKHIMTTLQSAISPDFVQGKPYYGAMFVKLAWQCSNTFRITDHQGGCNGARIRYTPQSNWTVNTDMDKVLEILEPIKQKYGAGLSYSDLIIFAAQTALEVAGAPSTNFCPGRTDAVDGAGSENLEPRLFAFDKTVEGLRYKQKLLDMSDHEMVALQSRLRSSSLLNHSGVEWTQDPSKVSNEYYKVLLNYTWEKFTTNAGISQYKAQGYDIYMEAADVSLLYDAEYMTIAQDFASDNNLYLTSFSGAWTKLVISDRFDGPVKNLCTNSTLRIKEYQ